MRLFAVIVFLSLLIPLVCSESEVEDESCKYTRKTTIHKMILSVTLSAKGAMQDFSVTARALVSTFCSLL